MTDALPYDRIGGDAGDERSGLVAAVTGAFAALGDRLGWAASALALGVVVPLACALALVRRLWRAADRLLLALEKAVLVVALAVMSVLVFAVAADRWLDSVTLGWAWATKLALFGMVWVGFIGASVATHERKHLAIDVAAKVLSPGGARIASFFAHGFSAAFCFVLAVIAGRYTAESFEFGDREAVLPWIPLWVVNGVIPLTLVIMGLRFVADMTAGPPSSDLPVGDDEHRHREPVIVVRDLAVGMVLVAAAFGLQRAGVPAIAIAALVALVLLVLPDPESAPARRSWQPRILEGGAAALTGKDVILAGLVPGLLLGLVLSSGLELGGGWLILLGCIGLLVVGAPLFVVIGSGAIAAVALVGHGETIAVPEDMFTAVKQELLLSIPFFVLAGGLMTAGTIADRLIGVARAAIGWMSGGLGISTVVACLLFAAISGSAPVTVIAIGSIMLPALLRDRYDEPLALGLVSTAGTLGILIPPSIPMIIYAIVAPSGGKALSVRDLFVAGVLPGLLVGLVLAVYVVMRVDPRRVHRERFDGSKLARAGRRAVFSLTLMGLIFIGIYAGWFTVVEASAVAVIYALFVEFVLHRELDVREAPRVFVDSAVMMGSLFLIVVLAMSLNKFLTEEQLPQQAAAWMADRVSSRVGFLLIANAFLLVLGCLMDIMSAILIVAPLLAPIAAHYGVDPIHFGIIFIVNLSIGYITPPMGLNLFVTSTVFERPILDVIRAALPFTLIMLVALAVVTYVPQVSLLLLGR